VTILEALRRTLELVLSSQTSAWAGEEAAQIAHQLRDAIAALESGRSVDRTRLEVMFAPTGAIQETSIDNGWGDEFLSLSQVVDRFLDV
jgi:hypothetical protein